MKSRRIVLLDDETITGLARLFVPLALMLS